MNDEDRVNMWRLNDGRINVTITDDYNDSHEFQLTKTQAKKLRKQLKQAMQWIK